jgi:hypothetical protein
MSQVAFPQTGLGLTMRFPRQESLRMCKFLMPLGLGIAAAFAIGPAFAGEKETSPVTATSPNDSNLSEAEGSPSIFY